jgi:catechol 2,3-dioxygenase-like lactoylglutathione lyase family enzyme
MNIDVTVHPTLHHYGLLTAKLDPMIDWYRKMLGMEVHHRSARPANTGAPFSAMAFLGNNEADHGLCSSRCLKFLPMQSDGSADRFSTSLSSAKRSTIFSAPTPGLRTPWAADHGVGAASSRRCLQ